MCQMCDEYEAELRRMGIAMDEKIEIDLDADILSAVSRQAEAHGHSVGEEVLAIVRRSVVGNAQGASKDVPMRDGKIDFVEWARRIRAMTPTGVPQTDSLRLLREDRDR